jgi:hypothetical protein
LSRIIKLESAGKDRTRLIKNVTLAVRELAQQNGYGGELRDIAAFIALALAAIFETIDVSVAAWEKRGYWVKADKFRMEWAWSESYAEKMRRAVLDEDWENITLIAAQTAQKLKNIDVTAGHRMGNLWTGAWDELRKGR